MRLSKMPWFAAIVLGLLALSGWPTLANEEAIEARMRRDITFLASDECEGRGVGTKGIDKAAAYVAQEFQKSGLKPGGPKGSYYQPFSFSFGAAKLGSPNAVSLRGPLGQQIDLTQGVHFEVMGLSGKGKVTAPVVFAGYGISAGDVHFDEYKGLDVAGKVVILIRRTPRYDNKDLPFAGPARDDHGSFQRKSALAEINKAAAVLFIQDQTEAAQGDKLLPFDFIRGLSTSLPFVHVRRAVVEAMLPASLGSSLRDIERAIDRDLQPRGAQLKGWTATIQTQVTRPLTPAKNVIGVLEGSGPLAQETVVVGAHYDHLGYGGFGSRTKEPNKKQIHHGADDNGSGTTSLLELTRRFGAIPNRQGRRLVFIAFSGEEMGLHGSRYYCNKEPLFSLADTVAMVNLDMVGRLRPDEKAKLDRLYIEGTGTAKEFDKLVDKLNANPGFHLVKKPGGTGPSDHDSFCRKKIPVIFFWTGYHPDYHLPSDVAEKINVPGMRRIADMAERTIGHLTTVTPRPEYVQVASSFSPTPRAKGPRLGIMPDYNEGKDGVVVEGLTDDGPAAKGGLKVGDRIVELGGKAVKNLNSYMVIMAQQKPGQTLDVVVIRGDQKITLKVTPQ